MIAYEKCSFRNESHLKLLRYFVATAFDFRFKYWALHIPGIHNIEADKLSRFLDNPFNRFMAPIIIDQYTKPLFDANFQPKNLKFINLTSHAQYCYKITQK